MFDHGHYWVSKVCSSKKAEHLPRLYDYSDLIVHHPNNDDDFVLGSE